MFTQQLFYIGPTATLGDSVQEFIATLTEEAADRFETRTVDSIAENTVQQKCSMSTLSMMK